MELKDLNVDQFATIIADKVGVKVQEKLDTQTQLWQQQQQQNAPLANGQPRR